MVVFLAVELIRPLKGDQTFPRLQCGGPLPLQFVAALFGCDELVELFVIDPAIVGAAVVLTEMIAHPHGGVSRWLAGDTARIPGEAGHARQSAPFEDFSNKLTFRVDDFGLIELVKGHIRFGRLSGPGRLQRRRAESELNWPDLCEGFGLFVYRVLTSATLVGCQSGGVLFRLIRFTSPACLQSSWADFFFNFVPDKPLNFVPDKFRLEAR